MNLAIKRTLTISVMRFKSIIKNFTLLFFPLISIGYVIIFRSIIRNLHGRGPAVVWILSMAVLFNIAMTGIMFSSGTVTEEKEKHTLRVLLNSGVSGTEYLIGNAIPILLIVVITNLLLVVVSGLSWSQISLSIFLVFSLVTVLTSIFIGYILAILTSSSKAAGFWTLPAMFFLAIIPMFKGFSSLASRITDLCYTGILNNFIIKNVVVGSYHWNLYDIGILTVWFIGSLFSLVIAYKIKGLD